LSSEDNKGKPVPLQKMKHAKSPSIIMHPSQFFNESPRTNKTKSTFSEVSTKLIKIK